MECIFVNRNVGRNYNLDFEIEEVGLREGLQSNHKILSLAEKAQIVEKLIETGINNIELGSFVNPNKVPQMEGIEELFKIFKDVQNVKFTGLALNLKGVKRAVDAGVRFINISISASNSHQIENTGKTMKDSLDELLKMIEYAYSNKLVVYAGIQAVFGCYIEGKVPLRTVQEIATMIVNTNKVQRLRLSDTSGFATPGYVIKVIDEIKKISLNIPIILHLHDTFGMGMANVLAAINQGIYLFDSSILGMGGCPFMKGAPGNIATEDLIFMLKSLGYFQEIDLYRLCSCAEYIKKVYQENFSGKICNYMQILNKLEIY